MSRNVHCTYVSEKISKIRWRPSSIAEPNCFVTASCDNHTNNIRLWEIQNKPQADDIYWDEDDLNPCEIRDLPIESDITEVKFVNTDLIVASTSEGSVYLFKITVNDSFEIDIQQEQCWKQLHKLKTGFPASCTAVALYDNDCVSVGEDGRINLLSISNKQINRTIDQADSCTIQCVEFLRYNELLTANNRGQMKIWDLRKQSSNKAEQMFMLHNDTVITPTSMTYHPTQRHIVVCGDESGAVTVWDLRQHTYPLNVFRQHTSPVNEVMFHPTCPDQMFSCGGGNVYQWRGMRQGILTDVGLWYLQASGLNKYEILRLMPKLHVPINTLDICRDRLLCGSDNEAMYLIENIDTYNM